MWDLVGKALHNSVNMWLWKLQLWSECNCHNSKDMVFQYYCDSLCLLISHGPGKWIFWKIVLCDQNVLVLVVLQRWGYLQHVNGNSNHLPQPRSNNRLQGGWFVSLSIGNLTSDTMHAMSAYILSILHELYSLARVNSASWWPLWSWVSWRKNFASTGEPQWACSLFFTIVGDLILQ